MNASKEAGQEPDPSRLLSDLRERQGIDFVLTRRIVGRLAQGPHTVSELVHATGASRRWVTDVVRALGGALRQRDEAYVAAPDAAAELAAVARSGGQDGERPASEALARELGSELAALPPSLWGLDHVPATPDTAARRAFYLAQTFDLGGRELVCLGDHDLTSVATTLLVPTLRATVVDIDDQILDHVAQVARRRGLAVRTRFADLRLELPVSAREAADLVFTDPPYTPAGIELFLARGLACLRRDRPGAIVFCYDYNERQLARGLEVQRVLNQLRLAVRAVLPGFNEYLGAEAIGARSALWVCRPTQRSFDNLNPRGADHRIYTRGVAAEEAGAPATLDLAELAAAHACAGRPVLVRAASEPPQPGTVGLDVVLRSEPPSGPGGTVARGSLLVADLSPHFGAYLLRILLRGLAPARAVFVMSPAGLRRSGVASGDGPWRLVGSKYKLHVVDAGAGERPATVVAEPIPKPAGGGPAVARYLLDHPKARVLNAWREALVTLSGRSLAKNDARAIIRATGLAPELEGGFLAELSQSLLCRLSEALERTAAEATAARGA